MLAVRVDLHGDVEAALVRVAVARLHRAADPEVEREADDVRAVGAGDGGGRVARAVVHDEHLHPRVGRPDLVDHGADAPLLVEGGHDGETPRLRPGIAGRGVARASYRRNRPRRRPP